MSDLLSAQVSAILFGGVDDETFERVMGAIRRTEAFADLDLYRALQPSWHEALMTYDPPDPIPAGGWSRLMPHTDEAIRIFAALRAALATPAPTEDATLDAEWLTTEVVAYFKLYDHDDIWRESRARALAEWLKVRSARVSSPITESALAEALERITQQIERPAGRGSYIEHVMDEGHGLDDPCAICAALRSRP